MKILNDDLVITCRDIIDTVDTEPINSNDKRVTIKMDYYIFCTILLVTILLLTIVTFCYYCLKRRLKQKDISPL